LTRGRARAEGAARASMQGAAGAPLPQGSSGSSGSGGRGGEADAAAAAEAAAAAAAASPDFDFGCAGADGGPDGDSVSLLQYERTLLAELLEEDALCVLSAGLGWQKLVAVLVRLHAHRCALRCIFRWWWRWTLRCLTHN
jgi:hypothetical protein